MRIEKEKTKSIFIHKWDDDELRKSKRIYTMIIRINKN